MINTTNATSFKLVFPYIPYSNSLDDKKEFEINLINTVLPGISLSPIEIPWRGGNAYFDGGGIDYQNWTTSFIIDEDWKNYILFYNWIKNIFDGIENHGNYYKNYQIDASLIILDNYESHEIVKFKFRNIWPLSLSEVSLDYQQGDVFLSTNITFQYDYFEKTS